MVISRNNYETFFLDYIEGNLRADLHEELQLFLQNNLDLAAELEEMQLFQEQHDFTIGNEAFSFDDKNSLKKNEITPQEDLIDELLAKELEGDLNKGEKSLLDKLALGSSLVDKWRAVYALTKLKSSQETFVDKDAVRIPSTVDHSSIHELLIAHCEGDLSEEENLMLESLLASDQALRTELSLYSLTRIKPETISFPAKSSLYRKEVPVISLRRIYYGVAAAASVALLIAVINYTDKSSALTAASHNLQVELKTSTSSSDNKAQLAQDNKKQEAISTNTSVNRSNNDVAIAVEPKKKKEILEQKKNTPQQTVVPQKEPVVLPAEYLKYRDAENLATLTPKGLEYEMPEMKKVYEEPIYHSTNNQESVTLLAFLGKAASSRIMGTDAYAYTEKQLAVISQRVNRNFKFERIPLESKDELLLKIGRFEIKRPVPHNENDNQKAFWEGVKKLLEKGESK